MKRERLAPMIIVVVVVLIVAAAGIYFAINPDAWSQVLVQLELAEPAVDGIKASGFIEAEEVNVTSEIGGRTVEVLVDEGDLVEVGQVLVRGDDSLAQAQVDFAQAGLEVAQATLDLIVAGARPEQIRQAEAVLAQAEAARDGAYQGWQDILALIENPQELNAQIALAEAQVAQADAGLRQAGAMRDAAQLGFDSFDDTLEALEDLTEELEAIPAPLRPPIPVPPLGFHLIPNAYWRSWIGVNTAGAGSEGARAALSVLYQMRSEPQMLQAQADAAETEYLAAEAAVDMAQAQLDALRAGATDEETATVEALVQQAQAQLDSALVMLGKLTLDAPVGGRVLEVSVQVGELAAPGAPLVTLADLDEVELTVYVPENRLGQVQLGQEVEVRVDSFPDQVFAGRVATIAHEAEFTPRNVQTDEERVNIVFAVKVVIPNPDQALKPGMPADAVIITW